MKYYIQSDKGKIRKVNEDAVDVFEKDGYLLAIVADGMGGHQAGDIASRLTVEGMGNKWINSDHPFSKESASEWLKEAITEVNLQIYQKSLDDINCQGMGTTVVAALCSEQFVIIGHVGDSRCYFLQDGEMKQVTADHSLVGELVRSGQLSEADAEVHPRKNVILKALGTEKDVEPDIIPMDWHNDDSQLLLCTDGLTNKLSDQEIQSLLTGETLSQSLVEQLIERANTRGGEDNITVALISNADQKAGDQL
ncbi:protein serine/threonine phosphatase [Gracilibacillus halophilus YIM-C55.5]|uniref:protein-serine/threonine phosphatase n=1 Tax=Gracilibacillus halophilus YIM-C55.5 TaxID=1308866 RepID=N4WV81_9BACI|nr:Stp1/IreP family PP2C-type Ser/Thr phosphatase [Gracilibacillus halophilus]ENH98285.1 protein serine/threonine phosphatase [Gracilibacillus halophilus YIM-C55.5]